MSSPETTRPAMRLRSLTLRDFKSFAGTVLIDHFDASLTVVVGPNGCGKSCLVEGICFAMGIGGSSQLRTNSLRDLVNHSSGQSSCSATVLFSDDAHRLCLQRRVVGGRRSEFLMQQCHCETSAASDDPAWACGRCAVEHGVKRDALRQRLLLSLGLDIDQPERVVVHQAGVLAIAQKSPRELLHFMETLVGTEQLRIELEEEVLKGTRLRADSNDVEERLATQRLAQQRNEGAYSSFCELEERRARLEEAKITHLRVELAFHRAAVAQHRAAVSASDATVASEESEVEATRVALRDVNGRAKKRSAELKALDQELGKLRAAEARLRDELRRAQLSVKQHTTAQKRVAKSSDGMCKSRAELDDESRVAHVEEAEATRALRQARGALGSARSALLTREEALESGGRGENGSTRQTAGRKRGRGSEEEVEPDDAEAELSASASPRARELERALRELEAQQRAQTLRGRQPRAARKPGSRASERLEHARAESSRAQEMLATAEANSAAAGVTAAACVQRHGDLLHRRDEARTRLDRLRADAAALERELQLHESQEQQDKRVTAIGQLRAAGDAHASRIRGFLCECLFVSDAHACAANAALSAALRSTVVVQDKATAVKVVAHFARHKVGVLSCIVLDELPQPRSLPATSPPGCEPLEACVQCGDPSLRKLVSRLLAPWWLASDSQAALALQPSEQAGRHVVTRDGECFLSSGEMRKSAPLASSSSFALRDQLHAVSQGATSLAQLRPRLQVQREAKSVQAATAEAAAALHALEADERRASTASDEAAEKVRACQQACGSLRRRLDETEAEVNALVELQAKRDATDAAQPEAPASEQQRRLLDELQALRPAHRTWPELNEDVARTRAEEAACVEREAEAARRCRAVASARAALEAQERALASKAQAAAKAAQQAARSSSVLEERVSVAARESQRQDEAVAALRAAEHALHTEQAAATAAHEAQSGTLRKSKQVRESRQRALASAQAALGVVESQLRPSDEQREEGSDAEGGGEEAPTAHALGERRTALAVEERLFANHQRALDLAALEAYLAASATVASLEEEVLSLESRMRATSRRIEALTAERSRAFLPALREIDAELRTTFRSLVADGSCCLEFSTQPQILFAEGVQVTAKPSASEWMRFEQLSGGQQAVVSVALNLAFQSRQPSTLCIFDEIDAALDTQRTQALANHVAGRAGCQAIFVSHRPPMIEAAALLVAAYNVGGSSGSVSLRFQ